MTHPLYATFLEMEADARAEIARRHNLIYAPMTPEDTATIARRAADAHGMPWPEARAILIDHFAPRAN